METQDWYRNFLLKKIANTLAKGRVFLVQVSMY